MICTQAFLLSWSRFALYVIVYSRTQHGFVVVFVDEESVFYGQSGHGLGVDGGVQVGVKIEEVR